MKELRRLLIDQRRLKGIGLTDSVIDLMIDEIHYLRRVLRLRNGDPINVVDGEGNLWEAFLNTSNSIKLKTSFEKPLIRQIAPKKKICLAVVIPKQGFDEVLRMGCEIGVDVFQPLTSEYQVHKGNNHSRCNRWNAILKEAVEQSERLWMPELRFNLELQEWLNQKLDHTIAIATTRRKESIDLQSWVKNLAEEEREIWILIGPEGGWTLDELALALNNGCMPVDLGENILRTSTAAVSASQLLVSWRRISC